MEEEINKIVCRDESDSKEVRSSDTLVLSNLPSPDESLRMTRLSVNDSSFSNFVVESDALDSDLVLGIVKDSESRELRKIHDKYGNQFPGVEFEEVQITQDSLLLRESSKEENKDIVEIVKVTPDGHFSSKIPKDIVDKATVHWEWEKF